jgi:hypothetical protein
MSQPATPAVLIIGTVARRHDEMISAASAFFATNKTDVETVHLEL